MADKDYATPFSIMHAASLLSHRARLLKFWAAIRNAVNGQSYVVDLGTGTGILSLMAAHAGAKRVTGVDINPDSIRYAINAARINGLAGKISFVVSHFADFIPDEPADIVVCEMLSSIMLVEQQVPACKHATSKILKPGGVLLPNSAEVFLVPVESTALWERFQCGNMILPRVPQTIDRSQSRELANFVGLKKFDFSSERLSCDVDETIEFGIDEEGLVHGLVGGFQAQLDNQTRLTMDDGWRDLFLPFEDPIKVEQHSKLRVRVSYTAGVFDSLRLEPQ